MKNIFSFIISAFLLFSSLEANEERVLQAATALPCYGESLVSLMKLSGGLTNENYRLTIGSENYFVRSSFEHNALLGSSLASEYACLSVLSDFKIAPKPIAFDPDVNVLISEFIPLKSEKINLRDPESRQKACSLIRALHNLQVKFSGEFCPYETIAEYVRIAQLWDIELPSCIFDTVLPRMEEYKKHSFSIKYVPCHLDLHSENIVNDGTRFWLIDWEYAAMADPFFDLATLASVEQFNVDEMRALLTDYLENVPSFEQYNHFYRMRIAADARWALWSFIQAKISPIDSAYELEADRYLQECLSLLSTRP
jgi:thiamine kinase-like enzyme